MKLLIAGCHEWEIISKYNFTYQKFKKNVFRYYPDFASITAVVQGGAKFIDSWAKRLAAEYYVTCEEFPANWDLYGSSAGPIRNKQMVDSLAVGDEVMCFWDYRSPGTRNTIQLARSAGFTVKVVDIRSQEI